MRTFAIVLVLAASAWSAERTATVTGDWADAKTWDGAVPGDGDTVVVKDGVTVTVSDARVVGTSGPNGTIAVNLNKSGAIVVAKGGALHVRGDVVYTSGLENTAAAVTVQGGGTWRWDASKTAAPMETRYRFMPTGDHAFRAFVLAGTVEARATLDSDPAGGPGYFTRNGKNFGGPFKSAFTDVARIGDDKTPGWDTWWLGWPDVNDVWDVTDTTFTRCGMVKFVQAVGVDKVMRHSRNVHAATQAPSVFNSVSGTGATPGKGTREIVGNVFDTRFSDVSIPGGFTLRGNYFGNGMSTYGMGDPWERCDGNFIRLVEGGMLLMSGRKFSDSVVFIDMQQDNPHVVNPPYKYPCDLDGLICSHAGASNVDSGEWLFGWGDFHVTRCIILPNMYGYSSGEMTAGVGGFEGRATFEHNTWFGGYGGPWNKYPGFSAFQYSESGNNKPGDVKAFRSNILWNPQLPGKEAAFVKMCDVHSLTKDQKDGPPVEDVGSPANLDYNVGWNCQKDADIDFPNKAHYRNWGKGYIGCWSRTPGEHDLDVDPQFVDYQRDVPLFATKCLGLKPTRGEWTATPDKPYAVGDTALHATEILWGLPVLYRYIGAGENPEPGRGTRAKGDANEWRRSWEWASLHEIREGVRAQRKFGDDDVILHLIQWIRAGYAPTNPKLKGAAHDGGDIGAVPYQSKKEEGAMIDIHSHGHDTFRIVDPKDPDGASGSRRGAGKQIYFDPYKLPEGLPKADVIFISHSHGDHCSPDDVRKIRKDDTVIVATADSAAKLGGKVTVVKPGDAIDAAGLKVKTIPAYNINKFRAPGVPFHPKESGWVGYVVTLSGGTTVYHAGDSDATSEMKALKVDVALLPVSGTYVMTAAEAVEAANAMMPKLAIPMHYGVVAGSDADAETFRKGFKGTTRILKPER